MAIRMRRGTWEFFQPSELVAGELAVVTDGDVLTQKGLYVCYAKNDVDRLLTEQSAAALVSEARAAALDEASAEVSQLRADMEAADAAIRSAMEEADGRLGELEKPSAATRAEVRALFGGGAS